MFEEKMFEIITHIVSRNTGIICIVAKAVGFTLRYFDTYYLHTFREYISNNSSLLLYQSLTLLKLGFFELLKALVYGRFYLLVLR